MNALLQRYFEVRNCDRLAWRDVADKVKREKRLPSLSIVNPDAWKRHIDRFIGSGFLVHSDVPDNLVAICHRDSTVINAVRIGNQWISHICGAVLKPLRPTFHLVRQSTLIAIVKHLHTPFYHAEVTKQ